jgi:hypothetical protein
MRAVSHHRSVVSFTFLCGLLCGCATLNFPWDKDRFAKATAQNPVVQIVCLWEPAEGRDPEGVPCRGFAGQILFLSNRHATPVEVDGDVRIYLFDNVGAAEEQSKPLRQFDFSTEAWAMHLSKSAVGPSYSLFVPYVRRGQFNPQCSLRVRLTPKAGPVIFSSLSTISLRNSGNTPESSTAAPLDGSEDRVQAEVNQTLSKAMQKTMTIPLAVSNSGKLSVAPNVLPENDADAKPIASQNATDDRLERMEKLLQQVLAEKGTAASPRGPSSGFQQANYETLSPERAPTESEPPRRFRLNRADDGE